MNTYTNPFTDRYVPNGSLTGEWARVFGERLNQLARKVEAGADTLDPEQVRDLADAFQKAKGDAHEAYWAECEAEREREYHAQFTDGYYVNVYRVTREYGGPEEGGWWFDTGEPVMTQWSPTAEGADQVWEDLREQYPDTGKRDSVLGGDDYSVRIEPHEGKAYPEEYPHYE